MTVESDESFGVGDLDLSVESDLTTILRGRSQHIDSEGRSAPPLSPHFFLFS